MALTVAVLAGCAAPAATSSAPSPTATLSARAPEPEAPTAPLPLEEEAEARLIAMPLRARVASLLMLHYPGADPAALSGFMTETGAGGFIVMGDNLPGSAADLPAATSALTLDPGLPPLIAIDQEGGAVSRLDEDTAPAGAELAALPPDATREAFTSRAALLAGSGVTVNFGIVADVTGDSGSFIADRVLGAVPEEAALRVEQAVAGEQGTVLSTLKHFPGHGLVSGDSHFSLPRSDIGLEEWRAGAAVPFARGIAAGAELVMFGHLVLPALDSAPASLSGPWHAMLRDELGFDGIAVTDDMLMLQDSGIAEFADPLENATRAVAAGNDLLVYVLAADPAVSGVDPVALVDGLTAAVESGRLSEERVDEAALRLLEARLRLAE
ncbi:MAG TPA: glycoside hydrolase family 3 N-terminal domain-containing protein [Naasia sp.]